MFREVSAKLAVVGILSNTAPSHLKPVLDSQTFVILAEEIRNLTPSASGEPLGGPENGEYGRQGGERTVTLWQGRSLQRDWFCGRGVLGCAGVIGEGKCCVRQSSITEN